MSGQLSKQAKLLLFIFFLFSFSSLLSGTFVPIYLWKHVQSYTYVGIYILTQYISGGLIFYVAGNGAKKGKKRQLMQLGALSSTLFYAVILLMGQSTILYIILLGVLYGIGLGFFWLAYNIYYFEITDGDCRDTYNGWQGMLVAISGIIAPWSASKLIVYLGTNQGYRFIFVCSLALYAIIIVVSIKLEKRKASGTYSWRFPLKALLSKKMNLRQLACAIVFQGVREGIFLTLLPFVIFMTTQSEAQIGYYTLLTSFLACISYYCVGKWIKPKYRKRTMYFGAIGSWMSISFVVFISGFSGLLWFGSLTGLIWPFFVIPFTSTVFNRIGKDEQMLQFKEEIIIFRELALMVGRIMGIIPFFIYIVVSSVYNFNIGWLLLIVGTSPILAVKFLVKEKINK